MIGNLGLFELTLFGIIALIVLGPEKLPVAARTVGRWYGTLRRASQKLQNDISSELQLLETQEMLKKELQQIRQSEAQMKAQMDALQQSIHQNQAQFHTAKHHTMNAWQTQPAGDALISDTTNTPDTTSADTHTLPMTNRWFLLSSYDAHRRRPPAPKMPNYLADPLLRQHMDNS